MPTTTSVIISCAGIGSRLGLGQTKALIKVNGKSLIRWQLELLNEVKDIRVVVGYQANDVIEEVLKTRKDIVFVYNHNYFTTKTGASFYLGAKHAHDYVIEWDGDLLVHPDDVQKIITTEEEFVGYSDITSDEAVFVQTNNNNEVVAFSREKGNFEWTGPARIKKERVKPSKGNVFEQIEPYLPLKGLKVRAYDIDTYDDYKRVEELVKSW